MSIQTLGPINPSSSGGGGSTGGLVYISSVSTAGGETSVSFSNVPQTYHHLRIYFLACLGSGSGNSYLRINFNNNTSNSGLDNRVFITGNTSANSNPGNPSPYIGFIGNTSGSGLTGMVGVGQIEIPFYTQTNFAQTFTFVDSAYADSNQVVQSVGGGIQYLGAPVSSIKLLAASDGGSPSFTANCVFQLYGIS